MASYNLYSRISEPTSEPILSLRDIPSIRPHTIRTQPAWTAYQEFMHRMDDACVVNRLKSIDEQRSWWEETSDICQKAIVLHNTAQYSAKTADHLEFLEATYHVVQTMLETLESRPRISVDESSISRSSSSSTSSSPALSQDERVISRTSKHMSLSTICDGFLSYMTKDLHSLTRRLNR